MRMIITGVKDGKSCVVQEIECKTGEDPIAIMPLYDLKLDELAPRPPGKGDFLDIAVSPGVMRWMRVHFGPNGSAPMHHTDSIDCHTVVEGWVDLLLDDGAHRLGPGDHAVVAGVDHGWQAGPQGCTTSIIIFGTPKPRG